MNVIFHKIFFLLHLQEWIEAVRRGEWDAPSNIVDAHVGKGEEEKLVHGPTKYSVVCSDHFDDSDYTQWTTSGKYYSYAITFKHN